MTEESQQTEAKQLKPKPPGRLKTGTEPGPWSMLIYGTPGSGKSTLAAKAPGALVLDFEHGLRHIDTRKTDPIEDYDTFIEWLRFAYKDPDTKTVVLDGLGRCEAILIQKILTENNKETLNDFGYGKGHLILVQEWRKVFGYLEKIKAAGKNILLIGHEQIQKFEDPATENYDRFSLQLEKKSGYYLISQVDAVLFARYEMAVKEREGSINKKRAVGTGERKLHTEERPAWVAKNRFGLPEEIPMDESLFERIQ